MSEQRQLLQDAATWLENASNSVGSFTSRECAKVAEAIKVHLGKRPTGMTNGELLAEFVCGARWRGLDISVETQDEIARGIRHVLSLEPDAGDLRIKLADVQAECRALKREVNRHIYSKTIESDLLPYEDEDCFTKDGKP